MTNCMKSCLFLHAHFTETIKVVENSFFKAYCENTHLLERHTVVGIHWKCLSETISMYINKKMFLEEKKSIVKFTHF